MSLATLFDFFFLTIKKKSKKKLAQNRHSVTNKKEIQKEIDLSTEKRTSGSDHHHSRIAVKSRFHIEEYSFGQTTLEQVFIEMAKQQEAEDLDEADFAVKAKGKNSKDVMSMRRMHSRNEQVTEL